MGVEEKAKQAEQAVQVPQSRPALASNPFKEAARQSVEVGMRAIIAENAKQRVIGKVDGVPIISRPFIGASLHELDPAKGEPRALAMGSYFMAIRFGQGIMMMGLPAEFGLTPETLRKISKNGYHKGDLPAIEKLIGSYAEGGFGSITAIYISRPLDCLQFVNASIISGGARKVKHNSGTDLLAALSQPGSAVIEQRDALLTDWRRGIANQERINSFTQGAKTGDVIMFLNRAQNVATVGQARAMEAELGDRLIWLDAQNRIVDVSKLPGKAKPDATPFFVGHTAVFAGRGEDGRPLISQSHINSGTISTEEFDSYLATNGRAFAATAIVSFDFFAAHPLVANR